MKGKRFSRPLKILFGLGIQPKCTTEYVPRNWIVQAKILMGFKKNPVFLHNIVILPLDLWLKMQNTPYQSHADLQKLFIVSRGHVRSGAFMQTSGA